MSLVVWVLMKSIELFEEKEPSYLVTHETVKLTSFSTAGVIPEDVIPPRYTLVGIL